LKSRLNTRGKLSEINRKAIILFLLFAVSNTIWYLLFDSDVNTIYWLGIFTPFMYTLIYIILKKVRRRSKSKIKPFLFIPIAYTFFSIVWFYAFSFFDPNPINIFTTSTNDQHKTTINTIEDSKYVLIQKLGIKYFFICNPNLSYFSKIAQESEKKLTKRSSKVEIHSSKQQSYNLIIFVLLFVIQGGLIYIAEVKIYPHFKLESSRKHRRKKLKYKLLDVDSTNITSSNKTTPSNSNFPEL
jgi:amino acid transporter